MGLHGDRHQLHGHGRHPVHPESKVSVKQVIEHACDPREGWNLAFIFNASLSRDSVVCNSGLNCVVQEVLQVDVAKS